jgi:hypothetical protein
MPSGKAKYSERPKFRRRRKARQRRKRVKSETRAAVCPFRALSLGDRRAFAPFGEPQRRAGVKVTVSCLGCGQPMAPRAGLLVCSDPCRQREWRRRRRRGRRQLCCSCGTVFTPGRRDQVFCTLACAQRDYRQRKKVGAEAPERPRRAPWRVFPEPGPSDTRATVQRPALRTASGRVVDLASLIG